MHFEVINDKGRVVMQTQYASCIPHKKQIIAMLKAGYKIRVDGKTMTKKKLEDLINGGKLCG